MKVELDRINISVYKIGSKTFYVASRPDLYFNEDAKKYITADAFLSVTDRYVPHPKGVETQWLPWVESLELSIPTAYAAIHTIHRWFLDNDIEKIYIHCDAGTHRSPSIFGLYLITFHQEKAQDIVDKVYRFDGEYKYISNPIEYINHKIDKNPDLSLVCNYLRQNFTLEESQKSIESALSEMDKSIINRMKTNGN